MSGITCFSVNTALFPHIDEVHGDARMSLMMCYKLVLGKINKFKSPDYWDLPISMV